MSLHMTIKSYKQPHTFSLNTFKNSVTSQINFGQTTTEHQKALDNWKIVGEHHQGVSDRDETVVQFSVVI